MPNPNFEIPTWEGEPKEPDFIAKKPVDERTFDEFVGDHELHKEVLETAKSYRDPEVKTNFQEIVANFPSNVPESAMTKEEKEAAFGAAPLRQHDLNRPN